MNVEVELDTQGVTSGLTCARCGREPAQGKVFVCRSVGDSITSASNGQGTEVTKCLRCALKHWQMLKQPLAASLVVGTVLTILNQGDALLSGHWSNALFWKIPLTYCVPLLVATYGALTNSRK